MTIRSNAGGDMLPDHYGISSGYPEKGPAKPRQFVVPQSLNSPDERDAAVVAMLAKRLDEHRDHLRRIVADPKKAQVLDFEIGQAVKKVLKWFP